MKQLFPSNDFDLVIDRSTEMIDTIKHELLERIYYLEDNVINYIVNKEIAARKIQLCNQKIYTQQEIDLIIKKEFF